MPWSWASCTLLLFALSYRGPLWGASTCMCDSVGVSALVPPRWPLHRFRSKPIRSPAPPPHPQVRRIRWVWGYARRFMAVCKPAGRGVQLVLARPACHAAQDQPDMAGLHAGEDLDRGPCRLILPRLTLPPLSHACPHPGCHPFHLHNAIVKISPGSDKMRVEYEALPNSISFTKLQPSPLAPPIPAFMPCPALPCLALPAPFIVFLSDLTFGRSDDGPFGPSLLRFIYCLSCLHTSTPLRASYQVAAAQLVISTAAESGSLIGDEGWVVSLPLAASGPGEPFATAAGVLGLMVSPRMCGIRGCSTWRLTFQM